MLPTLYPAYKVVRDWSKSIGGGGPEQRGGGSRGFEPCARGGSCNFQLPLGGGSPYFITWTGRHLSLHTNGTVDHTVLIYKTQPAEITAKNTFKSVVSFLKCNFNKMYDFCFYISLLFKILMP